MLVLPHVLDVSVKFTPVHNFIPKKSVTDSPFIFKHDRNGNMREEEKWYKKGAAQTLQEASPEGQRNGMGDILAPIDAVPEESVSPFVKYVVVTETPDISVPSSSSPVE